MPGYGAYSKRKNVTKGKKKKKKKLNSKPKRMRMKGY
jgi:hypothetical protein|tara:strand:- start:2128 stop:2238 length:111 start_codon:yes stop_codon:yes gene_type:complete